MSTLLAFYEYILYTNDSSFLTDSWENYKSGMSFVTGKIDNSSLFYCTGTNDWGRYSQGGHNTEANMLMYGVLTTGSSLSKWAGEPDLAANMTALAANLKSAVNSDANNWDPAVGYVLR